MSTQPAPAPARLNPVLIDGKKVNTVKVEIANGSPFLFAVTCDMAIYFSWTIVPIKWQRAVYMPDSL